MPRFFFDLRDDGGLHRDDVGECFDGVEAVEECVAALLADVVRDAPPGAPARDVACEVRDGAGRAVYRGEMAFRGTRLSPPPG